jgi:hypothetical protein
LNILVEYDEPLSNFAFNYNFNVRPYTMDATTVGVTATFSGQVDALKVGRCKLPVSNPRFLS